MRKVGKVPNRSFGDRGSNKNRTKVKMDLELAAYRRGKSFAQFNDGPQPIPKRRPMFFTPFKNGGTELDKFVRRLRHSSWRRAESQNKQMQLFMDRKKFQDHQSWQSEYDRLRATVTAPGLQASVEERLEGLRTAMLDPRQRELLLV